MFSKMTQALILSGCLLAAGAASADQRNVIVPVIAGAAVGAVIATALVDGHPHHYHPQYQGYYQPRYQPVYQQVAYVPVGPRPEYRHWAPPPPRGYYDRGYEHGYDRGPGGRW